MPRPILLGFRHCIYKNGRLIPFHTGFIQQTQTCFAVPVSARKRFSNSVSGIANSCYRALYSVLSTSLNILSLNSCLSWKKKVRGRYVCLIWKLSATCGITYMAENCGTVWDTLLWRTCLSNYCHILSHLRCIAQAYISAHVNRIKL